MGRRSSAAKRSKAKSSRTGPSSLRPNQCRAWRPQPGPPSHVVDRQIALQLRCAEIKRETAARAADAVVLPFHRPTAVPSVALMHGLPAASPAAPSRSFFTERRIAACLLVLPSLMTAAFASFVASRRDAPAPAPAIVIAARTMPTVERSKEIDFAAILPTPVLPTTPPHIDPPGEIQFSSLRIPNTPPDVPQILPEVTLPPRDFALDASPPAIDLPPSVTVALVVPPTPVEITSLSADLTPAPPVIASAPSPYAPELCVAEAGFTLLPNPKLPAASPAPENETSAAFGVRLAQVARTQTTSLVIYNARYATIAYPGGDVSPFYGVCSDVIVRAYRALGVDLQVEIATAAVGSGDRNIDHRRVEVIRKFLAKRGESLAISDNPDDYQPGDIVTYYRPQNKSSTTHIAIVAQQIGPSGQPMIIHNRGWGVQIEDALFVDKITGHYRYRPASKSVDPLVAQAKAKSQSIVTASEPPRIRPKTPDGSALAKAGIPARALR